VLQIESRHLQEASGYHIPAQNVATNKKRYDQKRSGGALVVTSRCHYDIRQVIDRTPMISSADSGGASANTTYEIIRLLRPLLCHLLKAVENNLTGTGSAVPMRGVSSSHPRVDRRRCTNWLGFSLSRDSLPSSSSTS
jgi:hypothetical protein